MDKKRVKNLLYTLGKGIGFVALIYILYKLSQEYTLNEFLAKFNSIKEIILPLIILNFLSLIIGIYSWHLILLQYSKKTFSYFTSYYYYAKSDISKYLPGNVFHLLSRQTFASKIGVTQVEMAKVSLYHTIALIVSTIISSTLFIIFIDNLDNNIKILMGLSSLGVILGFYFIFPLIKKEIKILTIILLTISIALQGVMLSLIIYWQVDSLDTSEFFKIASIYIISWLIGFVTPGASGGLGVREGAFLAISNFINLNISNDIILFSILLVRLINILVDILMFLSTFLIKNK